MTGIKLEFKPHKNCFDEGENYATPSYVAIRTSDRQRILAQSSILASTSPVLARKIKRATRGWNSVSTIRISGVPSDSVIAFVQLLQSTIIAPTVTSDIEDMLEKHSLQFLALSHAYQIGWLKKKCEITVATTLTPDRVIDVLKIAKLCDAAMLYQQCMKLIIKDFSEVQRSDGWQFLMQHDPALELEILETIEETEQRKSRWKQQRAAQKAYQQLNEAMDCLEHIFTEGCTEIGPRSRNFSKANTGPCAWFATCHGLQLLLRHFTMCGKKLAPGGCIWCQRTWQLLHLHASICDHSDSCKVPLCNAGRFKMKMHRKRRSEKTWRLLVEKVARVRAISALARPKRGQ